MTLPPFTWGSPDYEESPAPFHIDPQDQTLHQIVEAVSRLSRREKALVLVLIRTIAAWGGLGEQDRAA